MSGFLGRLAMGDSGARDAHVGLAARRSHRGGCDGSRRRRGEAAIVGAIAASGRVWGVSAGRGAGSAPVPRTRPRLGGARGSGRSGGPSRRLTGTGGPDRRAR